MPRRKNRADERGTGASAARFLRSAQECRARDLKQLYVLGELVQGISTLIHALQKERGATSIFLGSGGSTFTERLAARISESRELEGAVRDRLDHLEEHLAGTNASARFYRRVGLALRALDTLPEMRQRIGELGIAPQEAVKAFSAVIAQLLAVGFETADIAADPMTSRALVALVNFSQGKEYAGQERATAGAAFSAGRFEQAEQRRLQFLIAAQEHAFRIFAEFAESRRVSAFDSLSAESDSAEIQRMRALALAPKRESGESPGVISDRWYEITTRRIDAMQVIEEGLAADVEALCRLRLSEARSPEPEPDIDHADGIRASTAVAMLITDVDPALNSLGLDGGIGLYGLDPSLPAPMRSILDVLEAQSRRIDDVSSQLESAQTALVERKTIEHAKGILMKSRNLSDADAYTLMRRTAMSQNKRLIEIAETIVKMADLLKA